MLMNRLILLLLAVACISGCDDQRRAGRRRANPADERSSKEDLARAVEDARREAANLKPPPSIIALPDVEGWVRSAPRSLPAEDHGFSVAYDHRTGLIVTFYQYTRGLRVIPNNLTSGPIQEEMKHAKSGIEQAVELGYWDAAQEADHGVLPLGTSAQQALWSRYILTVRGQMVPSDTYIWPHGNAFFKVRCTGQPNNSEAEAKVLSELLTALGKACSANAE